MDRNKKLALTNIIVSIGLVLVLLAGSALRLMNTNWDEGRHLHPDERFLSQVMGSIRPVGSLSEYLDTSNSTLNPSNHGFGFFVYGTLPVFIIRYVGEWTGQTGYDMNTLVGRELSAYFDIVTILLVFLVGLFLYNKWVGLGGAALYAFAVLPIQQAHFMTVDSFTNTFAMLTVLAAVLILKRPRAEYLIRSERETGDAGDHKPVPGPFSFGSIIRFLFFGLALGMATASKINAISLALLLPLVELVRYFQTPRKDREKGLIPSIVLIALAGLFSFLVFRIFQPYAFDGPGFFGMKINEGWWGSMQSLRGQATGEVDFPPALQWTRRELTFSVKNLVLWGIGIPFALTAFLGALGMLYKIIKRKELVHLPLLAWTGVYFAWQGFAWVKAMRYLLPIYPLLSLIAGWLIYELISYPAAFSFKKINISSSLVRGAGVALAILAIVGSAAYAWAFTRIYTRPVTRVEASEWILENVPGPINFGMSTADGEFSQPARFRSGAILEPGKTLHIPFSLKENVSLQTLVFPEVKLYTNDNVNILFKVNLREVGSGYVLPEAIPAYRNLVNPDQNQSELVIPFSEFLDINKDQNYVIEIQADFEAGSIYFNGSPKLSWFDEASKQKSQTLKVINQRISKDAPYRDKVYFTKPGTIESVYLPFVLDVLQSQQDKTLKVTLSTEGEENKQTQSVFIKGDFLDLGDGRGKEVEGTFDTPILLEHSQVLDLTIELVGEDGEISLSPYAPTHESSWDDGLPTSTPGYVAYQPDGGLYQGGLNLELYWPDDAQKLMRIKDTLNASDYIFISSNRQWGTISRVPERYPLSTFYYCQLMGCPDDMDVVTCYNIAEPGMFTGDLGFELVKTFTSYPTLFGKTFNDQFAEEAFSVYDHPKVILFKKSETFKPELLDQLDSVDLSKAVFLTPKQANSYKAPVAGAKTLMLGEEALENQRVGGTWAELFDRKSWVNRSPIISVLVFYLFVSILGWLVFPLVHIAFKGLRDKGYAFSKLIGLLLFAWLAFVLGSNGVLVTRQMLWIVLAIIGVLGIIVGLLNRQSLAEFIKHSWKQFLVIEALALLAFAYFLWVRYLNPDLWHQWKGGEKPMDFSYLNAVLKSSRFPAYDPWFEGGYINYYYYGQVIVGMPIKALGIIPAVAYNLILPLWYALLSIGTFSVVWNASKLIRKDSPEKLFGVSFWTGLAGMALVCFLGNLGELKVLTDAWLMLGARGISLQELNVWQRFTAFFRGIGDMFKGSTLPIPPGNWYWNPSRAIPGEPITEFPYFTFLYGDLHAHLIALPIVMSSIGWSLSLLSRKLILNVSKWKDYLGIILTFVVGSLIIGALKPTNTWDLYTFFALAACVIVYVIARYGVGFRLPKTQEWLTRVIMSVLSVGLLYALSMGMYHAFNSHFMPGFTEVGFWQGDRTPISSYLTHWGLALFIILAWFAWETYQWTAKTRMSELNLSLSIKRWLIAGGVLALVLLLVLLVLKAPIALIAIPVCVWALVLLLLPTQSDFKRFLFFMVGTGFLLTIVVELVHLVGDIGRMNVVFKLYMQAWLLINLAAASGLVIVLKKVPRWSQSRRILLKAPLIILALIALLFPLLATRDKATDRMSASAPHTLDGMKYMESSTFFLDSIHMDLGQDYRAILWLQENVQGSPVILEGQAFEYSWGNRYTIYTGLPSVVGWNYHQRQQRAIWANNEVWDRVDSVNHFYTSTDQAFVKEYIEKHDISYIIVGQLERIRYFGEGLDKFEVLDGQFWHEVYRDGDTVIYKVERDA